MVTSKTSLICGTALLALVLVGVFVLVALHDVAGKDGLVVVGGIVSLAAAAVSGHAGVSAGARAAGAQAQPTPVSVHLDGTKIAEAVTKSIKQAQAKA